MPEPDGALRQLLRASDHLKLILHVSLINDADLSRTLAVVSHTNEIDRHEEGSIFLIKQNGNDIDIERVFPIFGSFSVSIAQVRRETLDLTSSLDQPRNGNAPSRQHLIFKSKSRMESYPKLRPR